MGMKQKKKSKSPILNTFLWKLPHSAYPGAYVTNEQASNSRRFDDWHGWIQGCGFSDSELFPEFRFAKLELRALLQNNLLLS